MSDTPTLDALKVALRRLPGVGPKSAQRMALHLLQRDRNGARELAASLIAACDTVTNCTRCNNLAESTLCGICASDRRDASLLCAVESPADLLSLEQAGAYNGRYFVLMGHLSPLDGIGPEELGIDRLESILDEGEVKELILATNSTVEGEATAHYLSELAHVRGIRTTRIAHGVPVGGELEYLDSTTLARAFSGRSEV